MDSLNTKILTEYCYDDGKPKYRLEDKEDRLKTEKMPKHTRTSKYEYEPINWKIMDDVDDNDFKPLIDYI